MSKQNSTLIFLASVMLGLASCGDSATAEDENGSGFQKGENWESRKEAKTCDPRQGMEDSCDSICGRLTNVADTLYMGTNTNSEKRKVCCPVGTNQCGLFFPSFSNDNKPICVASGETELDNICQDGKWKVATGSSCDPTTSGKENSCDMCVSGRTADTINFDARITWKSKKMCCQPNECGSINNYNPDLKQWKEKRMHTICWPSGHNYFIEGTDTNFVCDEGAWKKADGAVCNPIPGGIDSCDKCLLGKAADTVNVNTGLVTIKTLKRCCKATQCGWIGQDFRTDEDAPRCIDSGKELYGRLCQDGKWTIVD